MAVGVAVVNLILGVAYTGYGVLTAIEMKKGWRTRGFSHFGAAWIAMAFTCGPHHLFHGIHAAFEGRPGGGLDLYAVMIGLPAGITWLLLRIEAMSGGRGDRFISGNPLWILALPTVMAVYLTTLAFGLAGIASRPMSLTNTVPANGLLLVIYVTIGYFLLRTQLRNRPHEGGWSLSGLSLAIVFPTCALMHVVFAFYSMSGFYEWDVHALIIDWLAVPAGLYFLWVVRALYRDALKDWNNEMSGQSKTRLAVAG